MNTRLKYYKEGHMISNEQSRTLKKQNRWNYLNKYAYFCPYRFLLQGYKKALDVNNLWILSKEDKAITNVKAFYECWKHSGKEMRCVDQFVFHSILCRSAKILHTCIQKGYLDINFVHMALTHITRTVLFW